MNTMAPIDDVASYRLHGERKGGQRNAECRSGQNISLVQGGK